MTNACNNPLEGHEDVGSTVERLSEHVRILRNALKEMLALSDDEAVAGGFGAFMALDLAAQSKARAALEATKEG